MEGGYRKTYRCFTCCSSPLLLVFFSELKCLLISSIGFVRSFQQGYMGTRCSQHPTLHLPPSEYGLKRTCMHLLSPFHPFFFSCLLSLTSLFFVFFCFFCLGGFEHLLYLLASRGYTLRILPPLPPSLPPLPPLPPLLPPLRESLLSSKKQEDKSAQKEEKRSSSSRLFY